jgi:hypothetical protein
MLWEWIDVSFLYWQPIQQHMQPTPNIDLKNRFQPGFKLSAGTHLNRHLWDVSLEYTYFHSTQHRASKISKETALQGESYLPYWIHSINAESNAPMITALNASWSLELNFLDTTLRCRHPYNLRTSFGLRSSWIDQRRRATYSDILRSELETKNYENTDSFGIGPRICFETEMDLAKGFKLVESTGFDILFTHYRTKGSSSNLFDGQTTLVTNTKHTHINTLRPHLDIEVGARWELDFKHQHVDFSATYGFQVFWNQNMFSSDILFNTPNGDLYINGVTFAAKLEF